MKLQNINSSWERALMCRGCVCNRKIIAFIETQEFMWNWWDKVSYRLLSQPMLQTFLKNESKDSSSAKFHWKSVALDYLFITSCIRCRKMEKSIFVEINSRKSTPIITISDSQNAIPMMCWMFQYPDFEFHVEFRTVVIKSLRNVSFSNRNFAGIFINWILASWFALCRHFRTL